MPKQEPNEISRDRLAELLNEDLSREYRAIISSRGVFPGTEAARSTWTWPPS